MRDEAQDVVEPSLIHQRARDSGDDPAAILSIEPVFGLLGRDTRLVTAVRSWLLSMTSRGVADTLSKAGDDGLF